MTQSKLLEDGASDMTTNPAVVSFEQYVRLALSHAEYEPNDDGAWTVTIAPLPGCVTYGETRRQAVEMAKDAIEAWLLTAIRFSDPIPELDECVLQYVSDAFGETASRPAARLEPSGSLEGHDV